MDKRKSGLDPKLRGKNATKVFGKVRRIILKPRFKSLKKRAKRS